MSLYSTSVKKRNKCRTLNKLKKSALHFLETKETHIDEKGVSKVRTNVKCNHCSRCFVLRNVQQLVCHLAAPSAGLGKDSACASVPPAVRLHFAERAARYDEEKVSKTSKERCRVASESLEL